MKNKKPYTQFIPSLMNRYKKQYGLPLDEVPLERLVDACNETLEEGARLGKDISNYANQMKFEAFVMRSPSTMHVYMPDKAFCDWLVSCVKKLEWDHVEFAFECLSRCEPVILHFPCGEGQFSIAASMLVRKHLTEERNERALVIEASHDRGGWWMFLKDGVNDLTELEHEAGTDLFGNKTLNRDSIVRSILLFAGLGMYCECFPEMLKKGLPESLKHPSHHQFECLANLEVSPKVCHGGTHASPMAHYRTGHFRTLRSERFTHKRFQVVFVKETFVCRDKAETVLALEGVGI